MLKIVNSVTNAIGALNYKGTWNAASNTPTLTSGVGTKGDYYVVSTSGTTTLDGISVWSVGDWAVFNGTVWQKVDGGTSETFVNLTVTSTANIATGNVANLVSSNVTITGGNVAVNIANATTLNVATAIVTGNETVLGNVTISGNATVSGNVIGNVAATNVVAVSYQISSTGVVTETTTARTLTSGDNGNIIYCTNTSAITITTASGLGAGFVTTVFQGSTGNVTIAAGSGTTVKSYSSNLVSKGQYARISIFAPIANAFIATGDIGAAVWINA